MKERMPDRKLELLTARPFIKENTMSEMHFSLPCGSLTNSYTGAQFEGDLGEILALGSEISPYIGLREKWESP